MKKASMFLSALAGLVLLAPAAFAQGSEGAAAGAGKGALVIAAIFGVGIAAFGCGLGMEQIRCVGSGTGNISGADPSDFCRLAPVGGLRSGIHFHSPPGGLSGSGDRGRALIGFAG